MIPDSHLEFVRFCLTRDSDVPVCVENIDWAVFLKFCEKQAILGIVFDGISRCQRLSFPKPILLNWIGKSEQIRNRNAVLNHRIEEIQVLFLNAGFRNCVLKGQGNALMYPDPNTRMPGDIDLWVDGNRQDINKFVYSLNNNVHKGYKDISFYYKEVEIEVHYFPTYLNSFFYNNRLKKYISANRDAQFEHIVSVEDSSKICSICIPTDDFNVVYQMCHLYHHFFSEGIGLRHLIDYYYLLKRKCNPFDFKRLGMQRFVEGIMWIEKEILGLEEQYFIALPNEKNGRMIWKEILKYGNFNKVGMLGKTSFSIKLSSTLRPFKYLFKFPCASIDRLTFHVWLQVWKLFNR